jgi:sacsin
MICYNDVGSRLCLVEIGSNFLAHPDIPDRLAHKLGLRRLGLISSEDGCEDDIDMGEELITTIRNRLREYTDSQLLLEFLANASDAGANEFNILLDERISADTALISSRCRDFHHVPSLVIHNDSVFTDDDFRAILRTGIGGKTGRVDTIGQFGLGALTMFHVTEVWLLLTSRANYLTFLT